MTTTAISNVEAHDAAGTAVSTIPSEKLELLEHKLERRPTREELQSHNVLKPNNVAPALQAKAEQLKHRQLEDALEKKLERRPAKSELVEHNILKDTSVAPALQARQEELRRSRLEDELEQRLEQRPTKSELVEHNILKDTS
ncbi:hypothetical protein LPJ56_000858, partial [Coemansia sp. RSA 2599]